MLFFLDPAINQPWNNNGCRQSFWPTRCTCINGCASADCQPPSTTREQDPVQPPATNQIRDTMVKAATDCWLSIAPLLDGKSSHRGWGGPLVWPASAQSLSFADQQQGLLARLEAWRVGMRALHLIGDTCGALDAANNALQVAHVAMDADDFRPAEIACRLRIFERTIMQYVDRELFENYPPPVPTTTDPRQVCCCASAGRCQVHRPPQVAMAALKDRFDACWRDVYVV